MKKRLFAMTLAVLMLCTLVGCKDTKPDDKDIPATTTTTPQAVAPIELVEGQIPADCLFDSDPEAIVHDHAVLLKANAPLTELRFLALNPDPPTVDKVLFGHDSLDEGRYWAIHTYINDAVPNRGVACTDEEGKTYYYAITYSMKGDGSPSLSLTALNIEVLSGEQLDKINTFLNDPDNLGFVQRTFDRPEEVQWSEVLTADVTFGVDEREWSDAERQAMADYLEDTPGTAIRYPRADVEALFQKRLGLSPTELDTPISAPYSEEYDAYYRSFLGIEWVPIYVTGGKIETGVYIVDCNFGYYDAACRVTMRATDDGFQFISNVDIETDAVDLSDAQLEEIETYLNAKENNGFVSMNEYFDSKDASLSDALYNIGVPYWDWTDAETEAYLKATGQTDKEAAFLSVVFRHDRAKTEALIQEKLGISITLSEDNMKMRYIEELDSFFDSHTDTSYQTVEVVDGYASGGMYYVDYELDWGNIGRVVLLPVEDGYRFIANIYTNE